MSQTHLVGLPALLRPLTVEDRALFSSAVATMREPISDFSFVSVLCWSEPLQASMAEIEGHVCVFSHADGDLSMLLPPLALSADDRTRLPACVQACFALMDAANAAGPGVARSRIEYVSDEMLERLREDGVGPLSASPSPGDYVYPREALVELAGGPLKSKRKLRSKFLRENPDITTGPIRPQDVPECLELLEVWRLAGDSRHEGEANDRLVGTDVLRAHDQIYTRRMLGFIPEFGLPSMTVRCAGRLVGFTVGEFLTPTMAVVHIEKTHPDYAGSAQFIFSEFCRTALADADEINAGDDWGIPSLRFTKSSYRPSRLLSKTVLTRDAVVETGAVEPGVVGVLTMGRRAHAIQPVPTRPAAAVRSARRDDARAIERIEQLAFPGSDDLFSLRQIQRLIANPRARVQVAEVDGRIVGWSVALIRAHRRWRSGRVYSVAVDPEHTGRGIGRDLLNRAIALLGEEGIGRIYLEVRAQNAGAIALYRSTGFKVLRTLGNYYGPGADGLRMRRIADEADTPLFPNPEHAKSHNEPQEG